MTSAIATEQAARSAALPFWKNPKLDLWIVWWTMPVFYNIFAIAFFGLAKTQPFPRVFENAGQVVAWMSTHPHDIVLGNFMWIVAIGFTAWHIGLIAMLINRMSVSNAWAYAYLGVMAAAALPGGILFSYGYSLLVMRPDRDPNALMFLYDYANLTFAGSMGVFFMGSLILCIAILFDKNRILPKWFGYASIWNLTTEFTVAPCWIFRNGELAWNGSISYYWNMVIYGTWQVMYIYAFYRAIRTWPPRDEVEALNRRNAIAGHVS